MRKEWSFGLPYVKWEEPYLDDTNLDISRFEGEKKRAVRVENYARRFYHEVPSKWGKVFGAFEDDKCNLDELLDGMEMAINGVRILREHGRIKNKAMAKALRDGQMVIHPDDGPF